MYVLNGWSSGGQKIIVLLSNAGIPVQLHSNSNYSRSSYSQSEESNEHLMQLSYAVALSSFVLNKPRIE